jgi:hypothetical protein
MSADALNLLLGNVLHETVAVWIGSTCLDSPGTLAEATDSFRERLAAAGYAVVPVPVLTELASDLEAYVMREYGRDALTPGYALRRARDLEIVDTARAMLAAAGEGGA